MTPLSENSLAPELAGSPSGAVGKAAWTALELTLALGFLWLMAGLPGLGS